MHQGAVARGKRVNHHQLIDREARHSERVACVQVLARKVGIAKVKVHCVVFGMKHDAPERTA